MLFRSSWYLALQHFKFKVVHRPGAQMPVLDFLSRLGEEEVCAASGGRGMWQRGMVKRRLQGRGRARESMWTV